MDEPARRRSLGAGWGGAIVFLTSASVLVLEILAGRLLAPYVGVTLETYTAVIGTVLAGISLGSWAGGHAADRVPPRRLIGPLIALGGVLSMATVPLVRMAGEAFRGSPRSSVLLLSVIAFLAPAAVLSAVTPAVAKLLLDDLGETGRVVGRISAIGTAGAIAGTFATGFFLVERFPTRGVILGIGVALVAGGCLLVLVLSEPRGRLLPALVTLAVVSAVGVVTVGSRCETQTVYYCARIETDARRPSGRLLILDTLWHSYVDLADPRHLEFAYIKALGAAADMVRPAGAPIDALHLGGGGFTIPRYVDVTRPGSRSLVLEVDSGIVDIASRQLGLVTDEALRVTVGDARVSVRSLSDDSYDLVIGDAFGGLAVPWHLATTEFSAEIDRVLRPDGIYAANVIAYPPLGLLRAEVATIQTVFAHTALVAFGSVDGDVGGNFILLASRQPLPIDGLRPRLPADSRILIGSDLQRLVAGQRPLTDDRAPTDQLLNPP